MIKWIVAVGALFAGHAGAATLFSEDFEKGIGKRWQPVKFEGQTAYTIAKELGNSVLQAKAASTASGLGTKIGIPVKPNTTFSWRWKLDRTPPNGSEDVKKTFDHTVRMYVAFKGGLGPPRTVNYVWGNKLAAGKTFNHPSSGRARFIVLQSGDAKAGQWLMEKRDLGADWKMLFGSDEVPSIVAVGLMTDSDGTASTVTGWYDDLVISAP